MNKQKSTREDRAPSIEAAKDNAVTIETTAVPISISKDTVSSYSNIVTAIAGSIETAGSTLWVSKEVLDRFRSFVLSKHGQVRGYLKMEAEKALLYWMEASSNSSKKVNAASIETTKLDGRTKRVLDELALLVKARGIVELPAWQWKGLLKEALEKALGRKPDPRTVRRYLGIVRGCCIIERGIVWRWKNG